MPASAISVTRVEKHTPRLRAALAEDGPVTDERDRRHVVAVSKARIEPMCASA